MLAKKLMALGLGTALALVLCLPVSAAGVQSGRFDLPQFDLPCRAAILIDQDSGMILYEKQADRQLPIASITKVMTLLLTMEAVEAGRVSYQDKVPVSEHAYHTGGSQIWLEPGEEFTLDEMLRAICVSSANDAAVAVAEFIGGSESAFVEMMNRKAAELGMGMTHFENACGLDTEGHLSCARDVAIMSREILTKYPDITRYTTIWTDSLRNGQTQLVNTNKLLRRYPGMTGLKTGTTGGAGVCLSASATRDGLSLIGVALGSPSSADRFASASALLDYGFANFENAEVSLPGDAAVSLPVRGGCADRVNLVYPETEHILMKKGEGQGLEGRLDLPENLEAPVKAGQQVGTMTAVCRGETLGSWPILAENAVPELTLPFVFSRLWESVLTY